MAAEKRWTIKQKVALSKAIDNLPENEHEFIYKIIAARDPDALENCPGGTTIDFNLLRPQTLRELESYTASHSANTQSEIEENPAEHEREVSSSESASNTRKSPRSKESDVQENNPAEHEIGESSSKSASSTRKSPRSKESEIKVNNPAEQEKEESSSISASNTRKSPRGKKSESKGINPAEHEKEKSSSASTSNTRKSPRGKGATGSAEKTEEVSIKARLRGTSRKSEASHSKKD